MIKILEFDFASGEGQVDQVELTTGSRVEKASRVMLTRLTTLGRHRFGLVVVAHDFPESTTADGLLGLDFLRDAVLKIDFQTGDISLS